MKTKLKSLLLILLILVFVSSALVGCGDSNTNKIPKVTTKKEETTDGPDRFDEIFGTQNLDNTVFRMAGVQYDLWSQYYDMRIDVSEEDAMGSELDKAIYLRNRKVEEKLNVIIEYMPTTEWLFDLSTYLDTVNLSGVEVFDTLQMVDRDAFTAAQKGNVMPYNNISTIDLSHEWWSSVNKDISIGNKYFFAYGNDSLHFLESSTVLLYNKTLAASIIDFPDLYAEVRNKEWTIEELFRVAKMAVAENGDTIWNDLDTYGVITEADQWFPSLWQSSGIKLVEKDLEDTPYFNIPGNESFYTLVANAFTASFGGSNMIFQSLYDNTTNYNSAAFGNYVAAGDAMFADGHGLFRTATLQNIPGIRSMNEEIGILPYPLKDDTQTEYLTRVISGFPTIVSSYSSRPEVCGIVLEAMACYADEIYLPVYYDKMLKGRYTADSASVEMLDIILANRTMDLGDTLWYDYIRIHYQDSLAKDKEDDLVSVTKQIEGGIKIIIKSSLKKLNGDSQ